MSDQKSKIEIVSYKGRRRHWLLKALVVLAAAGCLCFAILLGQVLSGARDDVKGDPKAMVILGCQLHDWGPSIMLHCGGLRRPGGERAHYRGPGHGGLLGGARLCPGKYHSGDPFCQYMAESDLLCQASGGGGV